MYKAGTALSGVRRCLPRCKRALDVPGQSHSNFPKAEPRVRSFPLKAEWARAFGMYAQVFGKLRLELLVVLSLLGLMRISDLLQLQLSELFGVSDDSLYIVFVKLRRIFLPDAS